MPMVIELATTNDAQEILSLQKLAFQSQAKIYDDYSLPPLTQSLEDLKADFQKQVFLKASVEGIIIGSVRAHMEQDTCFIGRLVVHPDHQNKGIGTRLMNEMERHFSDARKFALFTGHKSEKSIYFYQKLGYRITGSERIREGLTHLYMEVTRQINAGER